MVYVGKINSRVTENTVYQENDYVSMWNSCLSAHLPETRSKPQTFNASTNRTLIILLCYSPKFECAILRNKTK